MDFLSRYYPESRFGGFTDIDGTIAFYARVNALMAPDAVVLDVGCGRGAYQDDHVAFRRNLRILRGKCKTVIGVDVDPNAGSNPYLDEFRLIQESTWPVDSESVDLCVADFVLEHLDEPDMFFAECARTLRVGGLLAFRTTNAWSYIALAARLIPNRRHAEVLGRAQDGRRQQDVFPTRYQCNTLRATRRLLERHGFSGVVYGYEAEPSYLSFSRFMYFLGVLHQRFAPSLFKASLFGFARKTGAARAPHPPRHHVGTSR